MSDYVKNHLKEEVEEIVPLDVMATFTPLFNQGNLMQWVGTDFLHLPLKKKIEEYINMSKETHKNHFEQFLSIFIYVDLKLPDYMSLLSRTIKSVDHKYFLDMYFFKILSIYQKTSTRSALIPRFEELLKLIMMKSKGMSKNDAVTKINDHIKNLEHEFEEDSDE